MGRSIRWAIGLAVVLGLTIQVFAEPVTHRLALVSDPHVSDKPKDEAYLRHFKAVIEQVNAANVEAVVLTGDLTQDGSPAQMEQFKTLLKEFNAKTFCVPGNHDVGNKMMPDKKTSLGEKRLNNYETNIGPLYFSADALPGLRLVGICSSLMGSGLPQEQQQWEFLQRELPSRSGETVILFTHYPPFVKTQEEKNEYFNIDLEPRQRLLKMLNDADVRTILSGHLHYPVDYTTQGIHDIGAPAVSFGLPHGIQREGWVLITVQPDGQCTGEVKLLPRDPAMTTQPK